MKSTFEKTPITEVRRFWDARPCNIRHSNKTVGSREYFDEVERRKYFVEPHIPRFANFSMWRKKRVLEIGCGIGTDTINFSGHAAAVTAVDISGRSLEIARRRAEVYGLRNIAFYRANVEDLAGTVPVEPYDLIYSFGVLHHTPNPARAVEQLKSYCAPGTTLKLMLYHKYSWKVLSILARANFRFGDIDALVARHSEAQTGCPVTYVFGREDARRLLRGFEIQEMRVEHIFPYVVDEYVSHNFVKEWYFRCMPRPMFRFLERHLGWHLLVTARYAPQFGDSPQI